MDNQHAEGTSLELGRYARVLRRRWFVVAATTAIVAALALLYAVTTTKSVTATATANINVITPSAFEAQRPASGLIDPITEEQLARSSAVLHDVAGELGGATTVQDVRRNMTVEVLPEATIVEFTYTAADTQTALAGANALAEAYLDSRTDTAVARIDRIVTQLQDRRSELRAELVDLNRVLGQAAPGTRRAAEASAQRQIVTAQIDSLISEINSLVTVDTSGGQVVTAPEDTPVSIQPHRQRIVEIGIALGLVLGIVAAFVVNALDRRVRDRDTVARGGGRPLLGTLTQRRATVPAHVEDQDELRSVREKALAALSSRNPVVSVIDLTNGSRPGDVPANLALAFAEADRPVELILPGWPDEHVALLQSELGATVRSFRDEPMGGQVIALTVTALTPGEGELAAEGAVAGDADKAQVTLVGLLPRAALSVVLSAARRSDGVVLVAESGRTTSTAVSSMVGELRAVGTPVLGTVLVRHGRTLELARQKTGSRR